MFTAIGVLEVKASTKNLSRDQVASKLKKVCYITTIMDMIAGVGAILTIYLINRSNGFNLPTATVKTVVMIGMSETIIGFVLYCLSGNIK